MNKYIHILNNDEKSIIENHFLYNKNSSKQNFIKFCEVLITRYTRIPFDIRDVPREKNYSIELIWNEKTKETAMMYCFNHQKFQFSNSKLKAFKTFNGDMNAINEQGQNALMILAKNNKNKNFYSIKSFFRDSEGFDLSLRDNENNTVIFHLLQSFDSSFFKNMNNYYNNGFEIALGVEFFENILLDWIKNDNQKTNAQKLLVIDKCKHFYQEIIEYNQKTGVKNKKNDKTFFEFLQNTAKESENIGTMLLLETTLKENQASKVKMKI